MCSSWKRAQDPKPPCSETVKGAEGGEEGQASRGKNCSSTAGPEVVLLRLEGEQGQG